MKGTPTSFWGKLHQDESGLVLQWHPLEDHCADVAACFEALLGQKVIRHRLARTGGLADLTEVQRARLCVFAALHDVGKFNIGFQNRALEKPQFTAGHVGEVLAMFGYSCREAEQLGEALNISDMTRWATDEDTVYQLLIAAVAHHGRPIAVGQGHRPSIWKSTEQLDPISGIANMVAKARSWFPDAFLTDAEPLPSEPAFQHAFNGSLTLADWIGSDTTVFPFTEEGDGDRIAWARENAHQALVNIGLDVGPVRESVTNLAADFDRISEYKPREDQRVVLGLPVDQLGGVSVLEAETGSGKTEAALARFLVLFQSGVVDGLYFALPTRTAATQIHQRVVRAVERAFPNIGTRPPVTLAVPGYLSVDDVEGQRTLPGFGVLWNDNNQERWRYRGWAAEHPKRYLAGAIVVGTIDQVLLSAIAVSHAHLRATSLLRHLLVVDEVHASDAYMTRILEEVLDRHLKAGGHALLMSATLGSRARESLLAPRQARGALPLEQACDVPYPLITHAPIGAGPRKHAISHDRTNKEVGVKIGPLIADSVSIARSALETARSGARVIVLRNTVRDCLRTQEALERLVSNVGDGDLQFGCGGVAAPHHSRFSKEDRAALDQAIEERFGKSARGGGCVVVTTQTVQQSLDLDADYLITDLCPLDVLLQRVGRLHRHERDRPADFVKPVVEVLVPVDRDLGALIKRDGSASGAHGFGTVYEDLRILEATWRVLERQSTISIPQHNRQLVERVTHPDALSSIASELGGAWPSHEAHVQGVIRSHVGLAALNVMKWAAPFGSPDCLFVSDSVVRRIQTRLGAGDRLARFDRPFATAFGRSCHTLTIPSHLVSGADDEASPQDVEIGPGELRFRYGARSYIYDRLGLRQLRANDSEEQTSDD